MAAQPMVDAMEQVVKMIEEMQYSISISDPDLPDCPLIACSEGFEALTGYSKEEAVGRNCRFLNEGVEMSSELRMALRIAVQRGREFIGVLPNRRRSGELFRNLLHLTGLQVSGKRFLIGIQGDVTNMSLDLGNSNHIDVLRRVSEQLLMAHLDAWVQVQVKDISIRAPISNSLLGEIPKASLRFGGFEVQRKNTFLHVTEKGEGAEAPVVSALLRRSASDPLLGVTFTENQSTDAPSGGSSGSSTEDGFQDDAATQLTDRPPSTSDDGVQNSVSGCDGGDSVGDSQSQTAEPKGIGSAGHPHSCVECQFYFFHPGGCRKGADCLYCHEVHPRKNPKKTRRLLRRLSAREAEEAAQEGEEGSPSTSPSKAVDDPAKTSVVSLHYVRRPGVQEQGAIPDLAFIVGQQVKLPSWVEISPAQRQALQPNLVFEVMPPLPPGLSLDKKTGLICGRLRQPSRKQVYTVTVGTKATGPGSIELGHVRLASCSLSLTVIDVRQLEVQWARVETKDAVGKGSKLVVEFCVPDELGGC